MWQHECASQALQPLRSSRHIFSRHSLQRTAVAMHARNLPGSLAFACILALGLF